MNKKEAAEFLGVSVRALERYVQQGRIGVRYEKGKTRSIARFETSELEAFKVELSQPTYRPAIETRQIPTNERVETSSEMIYSGEVSEFGEVRAIEQLATIIEKLLQERSLLVGDKLLLTLSEAQLLTGLSRKALRDAIADGKLKAKVMGRSWRIKRSDLEDFVDELF